MIEINEKELWDEYARLYNKFTPSFQKELLSYVAKQSFGTVLDVGCGVGKLLKYLIKNPLIKQYGGIDSNSFMLKKAEENAEDIKNSNFFPTNFLNIDLESKKQLSIKKYDTVTSINVIYCLNNPLEHIKSLTNYLDDSGILIISSQNRNINQRTLESKILEEFNETDLDFKKYVEYNKYLLSNQLFKPVTYSCEEISTVLEILKLKILEKNEIHYLKNSFTIIARKI